MTNKNETRITLSGKPASCDDGAPQPIDPATGMHGDYWVLSEEERAKGFVRPVREQYKHVGVRPKNPIRDLTAEEHARYDQFGYVKCEAYPCARVVDPDGPTPECRYPSDNERHDEESPSFLHHFQDVDGSSVTGRFWTEAQLNSGCGTVTRMGLAIAETYARNPEFYGSTFCVGCRVHLPVGEHGEFVWMDGSRVGT